MAVPGETPTSPSTVVGPVFVTVEPPRTPKDKAVPRSTWAATAMAAARRNGMTWLANNIVKRVMRWAQVIPGEASSDRLYKT